MFPQNKGLSPVIAAIILIAVTVAVAVAATTWMVSMSLSFMQVDQMTISTHKWALDNSYVDLIIQNFGTTTVSVIDVKVNDETASSVSYTVGDSTLTPGETTTLRINQSFTPSETYEFTVTVSSGIKMVHMANAYSAQEIWYNPSWNNRKAVTIDNSINPDDLVDYQLKLSVMYDSDMQPDFSDLIFTSNDKQTSIPYWIESYTPSDHAVVWIKVPSILASSTETVYMYYGNPSATTQSNPDNTFDLFIDFTRDGVTSYGGSSQDQNPTQYEIIDNTILRMWGNNWKATMKTINVAGDGSQAICFDFKSNGTQAEINGVGLDTDNSITDTLFYRIYGTQGWGLNDHYGYSGDWQSYTLILNDFSNSFNRIVFNNDADVAQATNVYYRNVRVCQYTPQEPTTEIGAEETK